MNLVLPHVHTLCGVNNIVTFYDDGFCHILCPLVVAWNNSHFFDVGVSIC